MLVGAALKSASLMNRLLGRNAMLKLTKGMKKLVPATPLWSNQVVPSSMNTFAEIIRSFYRAQILLYISLPASTGKWEDLLYRKNR